MANYTKITNFTVKDSLLSGNPAKLVKGSEIDAELSAVAVSIATKGDSADFMPIAGGTFTGAVSGVTPTTGDDSTLLATTEFVNDVAFSTALPAQAGNAGEIVTTDGSTASWTPIKTVDGNTLLGAGNVNTGVSTVATTSGAANITLTSASAGYQSVAMLALGKHVTLPDATTLTVGGPRFIIKNDDGYPFGIRNSAGTLIMGVAPGGIAYVTLKDNSSAAGSWSVAGEGLEPGLITIDSTFSSTYAATVLGPSVALDDNTSIHFAALSAGFAAFVVDNAGGVLTTPVTVTTTASSVPLAVFKVSATSAVVFYGASNTNHQVVVLTLSGASPSFSLSVGTSQTHVATSSFFSWGGENSVRAPRIAQLSSTLYLATYTAGTTTPVVAISVSGATVTIGTAVNIIAASSAAESTTAYALTATTALVIYNSGTAPFAINAVVVSVSGTTCTVGTPAAASSTWNAAGTPNNCVSSCLLSATKALILTDNNTTSAIVHAITVSGTTVTWGAALTVETGVSGFHTSSFSNYIANAANRYNPHLSPLSASTALLWYTDDAFISRCVVLSESGGVVTAGTRVYNSITWAAAGSPGGGIMMQQGTTEFVSVKKSGAANGAVSLYLPHKITGTSITTGLAHFNFKTGVGTQPDLGVYARLTQGDYLVLPQSTGFGGDITVLRSNGDVVQARGTLSVPALSTAFTYPAKVVSSNRLVFMLSPKATTIAAATYPLRLLNVEIAA